MGTHQGKFESGVSDGKDEEEEVSGVGTRQMEGRMLGRGGPFGLIRGTRLT